MSEDLTNPSHPKVSFRDQIVPNGLSDEFCWTQLYDLKTDKSKIVRAWGKGAVKAAILSAQLDGSTPKELMDTARECFDELEKHGVKTSGIPDEEIFEDGQTYTVTNKITGKTLEDAFKEEDRTEIMPKIDGIFEGIASYYSHVFQVGGPYLADVDFKQFMYGTKGDDTDKEIYMVDIDPMLQVFKKDDPLHKGNEVLVMRCIDTIVKQVIWLEKNSGIIMEKTRVQLSSLFDQLTGADFYTDRVDQYKRLLNKDTTIEK